MINLLNSDVGEPFFSRVAQQGISAAAKSNLTLPALKEALRKSGLVGSAMIGNKVYDHLGPLCGASDSETLERARSVLNEFFSIIRNANLNEWEGGRDGFVCTNVGVQGYILLLGSLIRYWEVETASNAREMEVPETQMGIEDYLAPIKEFLESSNAAQVKEAFQVQFGSGGPREYYFRLCKMVKIKYPDFQPEGMEEWEAEQSEDRIQEADAHLKALVTEVSNAFLAFSEPSMGKRITLIGRKA